MKTTINGKEFALEALRPDETAVEVIRGRAGLTGTKLVCGSGVCGACTILVDGTPMCSCLLPAHQMDGREIQTIEQHGRDNLHPVQKAFMVHEGLQCGFCTPGFINEGIAFYDRWRAAHGTETPSKEEIALAMGGHLCRCGAYVGIYEAIQAACAGQFDGDSEAEAQRVDALEKVTGEAKYTVDIHYEGQLEGRILRSPHPHARVLSMDAKDALAMDGVVAFADLLEGESTVRHVGQPIAAIAAVNWGIAEAALQKVKIEYEILPAVIDMDEALNPSSPPVYINRNRNTKVPNAAEGLLLPGRWNHNERRLSPKLSSWRTGAASRRINAAQEAGGQNLVALTYKNAQQAHTALEPHAAVAKWDGPTKVAVHASTQGIHFLRKEIAEHFDLNKEDVQLDSQHIGGGFGGKQGLYPEIIAAVTLARFAERPVRVACDRLEEISYTALRPGGTTTATVAVQDDGSPEAVALRAYGHAGNGIGALTAGLYGLISPSIPRDLTDSNVVTHTPPGKPFRGPDAPLTFWAMEQTLDEVAHRKQTSPVTIRRKWYPEHEIRNALYDWVEALPEWATRGPVGGDGGRFRRGIGLSSPSWSFIYNPDVKVTVRATAEGIVVETASQDIGNGTRTALAKAIEDTFGISRHEVIVNIGDAALPIGPTAGGSQVTTSVYPTAVTAAEKVKEHLISEAQSKMGYHSVEATEGGVNHAGGFTPWAEVLQAAAPFSYTDTRGAERGPLGLRINLSQTENDIALGMRLSHAVVVTEVEVDTRLGKIRPLNVWANHAVGRIFVPALARSQVYGGIIQGLGYALYEEKVYDKRNGQTLSANLEDYKIPGIGDIPDMHVDFYEKGFEEIRGEGIGLAELCTIGVAASVGNAVFHATGWRPLQTPIRPMDVVHGLQTQAGK